MAEFMRLLTQLHLIYIYEGNQEFKITTCMGMAAGSVTGYVGVLHLKVYSL